MIVIRVLTLFLLMLTIGAAVTSIFFPLFSVTTSDSYPKTKTYYWRNVTSFEYENTVAYISTDNTDLACGKAQTLFTFLCCFSTVGIIFSGMCVYFATAHLFIMMKNPLCCFIEGLLCASFICFCLCVTLSGAAFGSSFCSGTEYFQSPTSLGYSLDWGFGLEIAAAGLSLITLLLECCS